jgi:ribosomal protein S2
LIKKLIIKLSNKFKVRKVKKTYFYKFIKLKRSSLLRKSLNNLQIGILLKLFFIEKNNFNKLNYKIKRDLFWIKGYIYHKKTKFIKNLNFFLFFNKRFFPRIESKRFLKKLFRFKRTKFLKSKLKKINFFFFKNLIIGSEKKIDKWNLYYLSKNAIFSQVSVFRKNFYYFSRRILSLKSKFFFSSQINNKIFESIHIFWKNKIRFLSKYLSEKFKKILLSDVIFKKINKFKKKIFTLEFKIPSFFKIFSLEFYVPYQILYFRKSIIKFNNSKYVVLPTKNLIIKNLKIINNFILSKFEKIGLDKADFVNLIFKEKRDLGFGFKFFNLKRLEKVLIPVILFFDQYEWSEILSPLYFYVDTFLIKKKFLPFNLKKLLERLLKQAYKIKIFDPFEKEEDLYNNKIMTLIFYKYLSEIFSLIFTFSPGEITFLNSLQWKYLFNNQLDWVTLKGKNWDLLGYYSADYIKKKRYKYKPIFTKKTLNNYKSNFFYFNFFLKPKKQNFERKKLFDIAIYKPESQDITLYLAKTYFAVNFIWNQVYWRMFYMWGQVKTKWFKNKMNFGGVKVIFESYFNLQNKFWSEFYSSKSYSERLLIYGFNFREGQLDFSLDWNFLVSYKGNLDFKLKRTKSIFLGDKKLIQSKANQGFFSTMRHNSFFYSFFSFLNRAYLLEYYLQFGHNKSNYNTSYKDYLIMIYNEWFIINLLASQLNLKRNFRLMFKMFYLGGFVCLVGAFNILLEGLVNIYGAYSSQPYTRFIWVNGLFSNFDKIFWSMQIKVADAYSGWVFFSRKMVRKLIRLWFCMKGILRNLSIDISFFPSLYKSSWVFLEACAKFYPTITTSNTETFLPTVYLEYTTVANDYSLLSLSLYINLLLILFKRTKFLRQIEFSVYPQKLIGLTYPYKIFSYYLNLKNYRIMRQFKIVMNFIKKCWFMFFEVSKNKLTEVYKYLFIFRKQALHVHWKQNFWKLLYYNKFDSKAFKLF